MIYFFNKCEESNLSEIEELADELDLTKSGCSPPDYQWRGNRNFDHSKGLRHNEGVRLLTYFPSNEEWPLSIQTIYDYTDEKVKSTIKKLISITGSTEVSAGLVKLIDIDEILLGE